ncbi:hypothetical protein DL93DRAFT_2096083 [Clavulina sp. PMI_390]|nr:hypothetical protein DL93DRAFT_2096083 [Clavulina sp. PMI_390]
MSQRWISERLAFLRDMQSYNSRAGTRGWETPQLGISIETGNCYPCDGEEVLADGAQWTFWVIDRGSRRFLARNSLNSDGDGGIARWKRPGGSARHKRGAANGVFNGQWWSSSSNWRRSGLHRTQQEIFFPNSSTVPIVRLAVEIEEKFCPEFG